jgi:SAM-dependent methyltransferase
MNTLYDPSFYSSYAGESNTSAKCIVTKLVELFQPRSAADVGCGVGTWLTVFDRLGVSSLRGFDGSYVQEKEFQLSWGHFTPVDLENPPSLPGPRFDVAISMEVAEHLSSDKANGFVDFLCSCSDVIAFSAAIPFQGGTDHRNEQWQSYWAEKFLARGYVASDLLRRHAWGKPECAYYYQQNVVLYVRQNSPWISAVADARWISTPAGCAQLNVVHPAKWLQSQNDSNLGLGRISHALPNALKMAVRKRLPWLRLPRRARSLLRRVCYTANTIRYRVEWARLREAFARVPAVETLFDGGAGSGEFLRRVIGAGFAKKVIALEFDAHNFAILKENIGNDPRAKLIRGSLLQVPLENESVDMVMSTQVIEHIKDHETAAAELCRILKPGGHALITVPHPPEPFPNDDHCREGYTAAELAELFRPYGLAPLHTDYFLTRGTTSRMIRASKLPLHGAFLPVACIDAETHLGTEQRRADTPFGILMLFQKAKRP